MTTTTYAFTPDAGQCALSTTLEIIITTPLPPTNLECWETATLNNVTCSYDITGTQPTEPTNLECWETASFNSTTCEWEVSGTQSTEPTNLECWEAASFNSVTCEWEISGTQEAEPTNLECWETADFNSTTCEWEVSQGTIPEVELSVNGTTLVATPGFVSYSWTYNGNPIVGATTNTIELDENGIYEVTAIDAAGCEARDAFDYQSASLTTNISENLVSIYPNPSDGTSFLEIETSESALVNVKITDMQGKLLFETPFSIGAGKQQIPLDLKHFSEGMYMVVVNINNQKITKRLVVTK
jgi:hypothetical protein